MRRHPHATAWAGAAAREVGARRASGVPHARLAQSDGADAARAGRALRVVRVGRDAQPALVVVVK